MSEAPAPGRAELGDSEVLAAVAAAVDVPRTEVTLDADPFELGLDSLGLIRLTADWRRQGIGVGYEQLAEAATLREWLAILSTAPATAPSDEPDTPEPTRTDPPEADAQRRDETPSDGAFPLAVMQHAYWIGRQDDQPLGGVGAHFYAELDGTGLDPERLAAAVTELRRRHEMLRVKVLDDGRQRILAEPVQPAVTVHDFTQEPADGCAEALDRLRDRYTHRRMDVEQGEVFDVALSLLPGNRTRLHIDLDMVGADAASMRVLLADLQHLYDDPDTPLPDIGHSYRDYLRESRARRKAEVAAARDWWRERLDGLSAPPQLPTVIDPLGSESAAPRYHRTVRLHHHLTARRKRVLLERARQHRVTPTAVLAAAFAEVLAAWSAEPRFLLNLPLFDRDLSRPGTELLIGDFSSSVLLDVDLATERPFADSARSIQAELRRTIARGSYSGVEVLRDLSRAAGGTPVLAPVVYTSALGLGEVYDRAVRETFGEPSWIISQGPQVWLDAQVTELDGGLLLNWDVREELFAPGVPAAAFDAYRNLLETLLDDEDAWARPVGTQLPTEQARVRGRVNDTDAPDVTERLHEGFHRAASAQPDRVALIDGTGRPLTYQELRTWAGRVTALLTDAGVRRGDSVAVRLTRGAGQVAAVLGVLGAGATYVPVGVHQPAERAARVLEAAAATAVLTDVPDAVELPARADGSSPRVLTLDAADALRPAPPVLDQPVSSVAYTIFTSGSTGTPKGVDVSHGAAMNTLAAINARFGVQPSDRGLALAELDFDMAVYDLFGPLSAGGSVVLIDEAAGRDPQHWIRLMREHRITLVNCVPALLDMTLTAAEADPEGLGDTLRLVLLGGDWVGMDLPGRLHALVPEARFVALGGMTEAAVHSTVFEVDEVDPGWASIPWGVPLPNMRARVVDARGRDCPDWVAGELWMSGAGLAEGYRGDPDRTAEKFVLHGGRRWYRTGDRARYRSDGVLEFLGRVDHQVKLRGHRIELGEVEAAAAGRSDVSGCVALVTGQPAQLALVAAGTPTEKPTETDLRDSLTQRLPAYMVPSRIEIVDALPLTANGKPDRKKAAALVEAGAAASGHGRGEPPMGWAETTLAQVWSELLGASDIGRDDDFFALGGDSLLATRVIAALRTRDVGGARVAQLFTRPRLADFAATLTRQKHRATTLGTGDVAHRHEPFPPTDVQRAFWIGRDDRLPLGGVGTYHYSEFDGVDVDLARIERAWQTLIQRHEMLRAVFDHEGRQRILRDVPRFTIPVTEVGTEDEAPAVLDRLRAESSHRRLDPTRWPLFDIRAVRYPSDGRTRTRLAVGLDYIVLDGASIMALYAELDALHADPDTELPAIDISFRDYVLDVVPEKDDVERARAYWLRRLDELPPAPELPLAGDPAAVARPWFTRRSRPLAADRWETLRERARQHGLTPSVVLLIAYVEVLAAWSDQDGVTVNLTLFNRLPVHPHINRLVGDFTSVSLIGHKPRPGESWLDAAHRLQQVMGEDLDHREASAIWLMQELARRTGTVEAAMPVVFSSTVGVGDRATKDLSGAFPAKVFGISQTPQVMLDNQVTESSGGILVSWDAIEELFRPGVLDAMFDSYCRMLDRLADEDWRHGPLPAALPPEQKEARERIALAPGPVPPGLLHEDVFHWAEADPDRTALLLPDGDALTYGRLAERATLMAGGLAHQGVRPGDTVALLLPGGADQIVAALGTLTAGAAYLPLRPAPDADVAAEHCKAAGAALVVTGTPGADIGGVRTVTVSDVMASATPAEPFRGDPGTPAHVRLTEHGPLTFSHAAVRGTLTDIRARYSVGEGDRGIALSEPDTVRSVFDVFGLLGAGATLVLPGTADRADIAALARLAVRHDVTVWNSTPFLLDRLLTEAGSPAAGVRIPARLRLAMVSGGRVGHDLPRRLRDLVGQGCRFVSLSTVPGTALWAGVHEPPAAAPADATPMPSGLPLAGRRHRVVDTAGRDRPDWVGGELWISDEGITEQAGNAHISRIVEQDGTRWYRTGSRARHRPDGTLDLTGRSGRPTRIGGRRVEPDEVETALETHPGIARAVVLVTGAEDDRRLHAVIVPVGERPTGVPEHLERLLPAHATPGRFTFVDTLDQLPVAHDGDIDRTALAASVASETEAGGPPKGEVERRIAAIWSDLLGTGVHDRNANFFSEGGDSLTALRLVGAVNEFFGTDVPVRAFLAASTLADLAARIESMQVTDEFEESGEI
ncbi:non-ribosomal peptide synthetase [Streptomyces sp. AC558_RSS880]|uniref:non-ribosomal peptide synthetase n=1 Tax=Streptomyces sp. AC558_RSS880 TaxID=2823687 RepID=UPI0027E3EAC6|nr:non-ribosomal peptide synthetase [Streptomyces sp. AC558_RSS880]